MRDLDRTIDDLIDQYSRRQISRRDFFRRAGQIGIGATGAAWLLAACGGSSSSSSSSSAATSGTPVKGGNAPRGVQPRRVADRSSGHHLVGRRSVPGHPRDAGHRRRRWQIHPSDGRQLGDFSGWPHVDVPPTPRAQVPQRCRLRRQRRRPGAHDYLKAGSQRWVLGAGQVHHRPDSTTVIITLQHPYADLPFVLNTGYSAIFNPAERKKLGVGVRHQGRATAAGRSQLVELVPGSHSTYKKWPDYPGAGKRDFFSNKGPAYLDGIQFVVLAEPASRAQELLSKNVDALLGLPPQDFSTLQQNADIATVEFQEWGMYQLGLNFNEHRRRVSISRRSASDFDGDRPRRDLQDDLLRQGSPRLHARSSGVPLVCRTGQGRRIRTTPRRPRAC